MTVDPADRVQIEEIARGAAKLRPNARGAYLDDACSGNLQLRRAVEALVAKEAPTTGDSPRAVDASGGFYEGVQRQEQPESIGRYRILRVIASGGMGTVYEALQEEPKRRVAVKVIRPSADSPDARRRFEYEAEVLGRLRHQGIAQVYEAGTHIDGSGEPQLYFAMEYVTSAKSITDYAEARKLDLPSRLELFARVCEAVHHGHQKGIIHRDLKPANILVDSLGQSKIIDFGVARATDSDLAVTAFDLYGKLMGSIPYMSPEQTETDPDEIDTRSDIYALGVVAYELLTGQLPYDITSKTPLPEAIRIIREEQPRHPGDLNSALGGDIETIVLHALEKDRDRRYQSSVELAQDIGRYLSNQPIAARPPSVGYLLKTLYKRNRALVGVAVVAFLALSVAAVVAIVQATKADLEARRANQEAENYHAAVSMLDGMFRTVSVRDGLGPTATVKQFLDAGALDLDSPTYPPLVLATLGRIVGNGYKQLRSYEEAESHLLRSLSLQQEHRDEPQEEIARTLRDLGAVWWFMERYEDAADILQESIVMFQAVYDGRDTEDLALAWNHLAACFSRQGKFREAEALYAKSYQMRLRLHGDKSVEVAESYNNLAHCYFLQKDYASAADWFDKALTIALLRGEDHIDVASARTSLAACLVHLGDYERAEALLDLAIPVRINKLGANHESVGRAKLVLARLYRHTGRCDKAATLCEEAIQILTNATRSVKEAKLLMKDIRECEAQRAPAGG